MVRKNVFMRSAKQNPTAFGSVKNGLLFFVGLVSLISLSLMGTVSATTISGIGDRCNFIEGTVTDQASGEPLGGVPVRAYPRGSSALIGSPVTAIESAEDGLYRLDLAPGHYVLVAGSPTHRPDSRAPPTVECQGNPVTGQDFRLQVIVDQELPGGPEIPMPGLDGGNLRVSVTEYLEDSDPLRTRPATEVDVGVYLGPCDIPPGVSAANRDVDVEPYVEEDTDPSGNIAFQLEAGIYCVRILGDWEQKEVEIVVSDGEETTLDFEISKTGYNNLRGKVSDFDANPSHNIAGAVISAIHEFYCPSGQAPGGVNYACSWESDRREGRTNYETNGVSERIPWVTSSDAYTLCFEHIFYNPRCESLSSTSADMELSRAPSSIRGTLVEGEGVTVQLEGHFTRLSHSTTTQEDGHFVMSLPSDAYRVSFLDGTEPIGYLCIALGNDDRHLGTFGLGNKLNIVQGNVLDSEHYLDDKGLDRATLRFSTAGVMGTSSSTHEHVGDECYAQSDPDGRFEIGLPNDEYTVNVSRSNWQDLSTEISVVGDATHDFVLSRQKGTIRGSVHEIRTDANQPVVGEEIRVEGVKVTCSNTHTLEAGLGPFIGVTDDAGSYEIVVPHDDNTDPDSGAFECEAEHDHFFPKTSDPVDVAPGQNVGNSYDLTRKLWFVTGNVYDAVDEDSLEGASVCAKNIVKQTPTFQCGRSDESGEYNVGPFEVEFSGDASLNPVITMATRPGYHSAVQPVLIGSDATSHFSQVDFGLAPEGIGDDSVVCIINNVFNPSRCTEEDIMTLIPEAFNCGGHGSVWPWVNQLIAEPDCGEGSIVPMGMVPEQLNCAGHDDPEYWLHQMIADPHCGNDPLG